MIEDTSSREDTSFRHPGLVVQAGPSEIFIHARPTSTVDWAHRPGIVWPCSTLSGLEFWARFDSNGLYYLVTSEDTEDEPFDVDGTEFSAFCSDAILGAQVPKDHPAYFVACGQYGETP